jgi:hypothetical protein
MIVSSEPSLSLYHGYAQLHAKAIGRRRGGLLFLG